MNFIHYKGAKTVEWIQNLPLPAEPFLFASILGDPASVCLVAFPLAFFLHPILGVATLLSTVFSEWINGILKWVLFGDRPYWWVVGYTKEKIRLSQFEITCETGPGSPSGHCMVAVAGWLPLILYINRYNSRYKWLANFSFGAFIFMVALSRIYVAAHFPHQIIGGLIGGVIIGVPFYIWGKRYFDHYRCVYGLKSYNELIPSILLNPILLTVISVVSFLLAYGFGELLGHFGFDINWSHRLAKNACLRAEWLSAATSLLAGYARISGSIIGLAFTFAFRPAMPHCSVRSSVTFKRVFLSSTIGILILFTIDALIVSAADVLIFILPILQRVRRQMNASGEPDIYFLIYFALKSALVPIIVGLFLPVMFSRACIGNIHNVPPYLESMQVQSDFADYALNPSSSFNTTAADDQDLASRISGRVSRISLKKPKINYKLK